MDIKLIFNRSKEIIINPQNEWHKINNENTGIKEVLTGFVIPYLLFILLASVIGSLLFRTIFFNPVYSIVYSIFNLLTYIVVILITPVILQALANNFSAEVDKVKALKLISFSFTPSYIIGIVIGFLPAFSVLGIVGLYGLYIMWVGFDILINVSQDKKVGFYLVTILIIIIEFVIFSLILGTILFTFFGLGGLYMVG